jgi:hypothetical protein
MYLPDSVSGAPVDADADAHEAWMYSLDLADAPATRVNATALIVIDALGADIDRIAAAAAVCRVRDAEQGPDAKWGQAAAFLDRIVEQLRTAGADRDRDRYLADLRHEIYPEKQPFQWPTKRRRRPRWWLRRLVLHSRLRMVHQPGELPTDRQRLHLRIGTVPLGTVMFRVCDSCQVGYLLKADVDGAYRGYGLGSRAVCALNRRYRRYRWTTTVQYPTSGTFWDHINRCTSGNYTESPQPPCVHLATTLR